MFKINKFIPYDCYKDIYSIDYKSLYEQGIKVIIFDLDNTISGYKEKDPSREAIMLMEQLKEIGFLVLVLSNNNYKRIQRSLDSLKIIGFEKAKKPLKRGYKKVINFLIDKECIKNTNEIVAIGDQILTDIWGANKMDIKSILVKPINLSDEKWYTKLNRKTESRIINKFKKVNYTIYSKIKEIKE